MLPTAFLSMWISNTATTAMMIPIMEAVLIELEATSNDDKLKANNRKLLAMSVCYGANCGGVGTIIGTGPNLVLFNLLNDKYPGHPLSFGSWMAFAVPIEIVSLLFLWIWLQLYFLPLPSFLKRGKHEKNQENTSEYNKKVASVIETKLSELGSM